MTIFKHCRGFSAVAVLIALTVAASMGASILVLLNNNQAARTSGVSTTQAFYSANGALEFAMRQILVEGNPNPIPTRYFMGSAFDITRSCNLIEVQASYRGSSVGFSIGDPGQLCAVDGTATPSSNSAPFNGSSIAQGRWIWFSASFDVAGLNNNIVTHVYFENSNVLFSSGGVNYNVVIPGGVITFDPDATCVSTEYVAGQWHTTSPPGQNGNILVSAKGFEVPVNLPGSVSPVTWNAVFAADQEGLSVHWQWGAAVYTTSLADLANLGVKASDNNTCGNSSNDKVGTPSNVIQYHVAGARAGSGSNYTGGGTGTTGTVVQCVSNC